MSGELKDAAYITFLILGMVSAYLLPTYVAIVKASLSPKLFAVNLLLGWTVIGWLLALVWAVRKPEEGAGLVQRRQRFVVGREDGGDDDF